MAGNHPPKRRKLSPAKARVIVNLYRGLHPWGHLSGRSMYGGAGQTERSLIKDGFVTSDARGNLALTELGREEGATLTSPDAPSL